MHRQLCDARLRYGTPKTRHRHRHRFAPGNALLLCVRRPQNRIPCRRGLSIQDKLSLVGILFRRQHSCAADWIFMNASERRALFSLLIKWKVDAFSVEICRFDRKERLVHLDCAIFCANAQKIYDINKKYRYLALDANINFSYQF